MTVGFQNASFLGGSTTTSSLLTSGGITASSLYNTEALGNRYEYQDTKEGYEMTYVGRDAAIDTQIANVISQLEKGNEDKAMAAYSELIAEMSSQGRYGNLEGTQLTSVARQLIESQLSEKAGETVSLEDYIVKHAANSFERGFELNWEGDKSTEADLLKTMCDIDSTSNLDGAKKVGGVATRALTGAGAGAAAGAAIGSIIPGAGTAVGAVVGGIIGGVGSLISSFFGL